jgi:Domain of unknown function (DUF6429)
MARDYDRDKVDEMVLALLYLNITDRDEYGARAWKSHDWDAMDRLYEKGYISDPKTKAKSVVLSLEAAELARELFERHFGKKNP